MAQSIRDVMTPSPETVESSKTAAEAAKLMKKAHAGMIPVVQNGTLVGTVTDRDITLRVVAEGKDPQRTTVGEIASKNLVTVEPDRDLREALELMAHHQVRRLPVVEGDSLVGVIAQADVAKEADERQVGMDGRADLEVRGRGCPVSEQASKTKSSTRRSETRGCRSRAPRGSPTPRVRPVAAASRRRARAPRRAGRPPRRRPPAAPAVAQPHGSATSGVGPARAPATRAGPRLRSPGWGG